MVATNVVLAIAVASSTGFGAGWLGRIVLTRLRRGVRPPIWWCEGTVAILWAVVAARAAIGALPVWWMAVPLLVSWLFVALTVCDLLSARLPDALTLPAYPLAAAALAAAGYWGAIPGLPLRALIGAGLFAASYAGIRLMSPCSLGAGDVKLAGVLGGVAGAVSIWAVMLTMLAAAVITLALASRQWRAGIPHGPAMLLPAWIVTTFPSAVVLRGGAG